MGVVDRAAVLAVLGQEHVLVLHDRHAVDQQLRAACVVGEMLVGVGHVADRRHHHRDLGLLLTGTRYDEERNVVLVAFVRGELHAIGIALVVRGHGPLEVDLPARVVHVIVVEVDRAILLWRMLPVEVVAREVVAGHGPGRAVDDLRIEQIGPVVLADDGVDAVGEVPGGDDRLRECAGRAGVAPLGHPALGAELHGLDLFAAQRAVADPGAVDLPVVVAVDDDARRHRRLRRGIVAVRAGVAGDHRRAPVMPDRPRDLLLRRPDHRVEGVDHLRLVIEDRLT